MTLSAPQSQNLAFDAVRTLVLYAVAEVQSGHARTIRVAAEETSFSVTDDGRGHAIERMVSDSPYLKFIYTHLDYPFGSNQAAPIQLQGLGMSLLNALCRELMVTVRKPETTLRFSFQDGKLMRSERVDETSEETGNTVAGTIKPQLQTGGIDLPELHGWLLGVLGANPSLRIVLNNHELQANRHGET
jgi:DNA gyrase/topoisomerase IV subunit B